MTGHILYPNIDPDYPATLSRKFLTNLLRKEMKFKGLIITDSMNMWAMRHNYDPAEAAVRAFRAGADMVMLSEEHYENSHGDYKEKQKQTLEGVIAAVEKKELDEKIINVSLKRVLLMKYSSPALAQTTRYDPVKFGAEADIQLSEEIARRAIRIVRNKKGLWPVGKQEFILMGASNPECHNVVINSRGIGPNEPEAAIDVFRRELESNDAAFIEVPYDNIDDYFEKGEAGIQPIIFVTEDYPLPGVDYDTQNQMKIIARALKIFGDRVIVVAFRTDYELRKYKDINTYICAYSSRSVSARAMARFLLDDEKNL